MKVDQRPQHTESHIASFADPTTHPVATLVWLLLRRDSLFRLLGLRNGDLIVAINGQPISSPEPIVRSFRRLSAASTLEVTIERRGETKVKRYRIQ